MKCYRCNEVYNKNYDIGYEWVKRDKTIELAPCCPAGKDCGDSCKTVSQKPTTNVEY